MDRPPRDRDRLKDVRQQDLTESRVNEDFIDWLKTKGPTWLLMILVAVTAYLAIVRWKQHKISSHNEAWTALVEASLPRSKEDVAEEYPKIFAIPQLALNSGAGQLLGAVQTGQPLDQTDGAGSTPTPDDKPRLSPEEREHDLTRADAMFERVLAGSEKIPGDDGSLGWTLHALHALFGRAAVAEARGDVDEARRWYEKAAERAGTNYPTLAEQARQRAASVQKYATAVVLPEKKDGPVTPDPAGTAEEDRPQPAVIDATLRELLLPADDEG